MKKSVLCIPVLLLLFSCGAVSIEKPAGFAEIESGKTYRAVSPEGLPFRVRQFKNYPEQDLDFWKQALKVHLTREGYQFISENEAAADGKTVVCCEWGAPWGGDDYIYLTAVTVKGKKILVAEAAGEMKLFEKYRDAILNSIKSLD